MLHGDLSGLDGIPDIGTGDGEREVDELQSEGDEPVFVRDFLCSFVGNVVAQEHSKRGFHVEVSHGHHVRLGFGFRVVHPRLEILSVDSLLNGEIDTVDWAGAP